MRSQTFIGAPKTSEKGFTLTEIIMTLAIIGILAGVVIATLAGLGSKDNVDRASQQVYDDLIFIRARSISTNRNHRINFTQRDQWKIEMQDPSTLAWTQSGDVRRMPTETWLTQTSFDQAGSGLIATPRGIYQFVPPAVGSPYIQVQALGASHMKSINVDQGGAIEFVNN